MSKSKALTALPQCALPGPRVVGGARVSLRGCYQGWQVAEPHGLQAGWRQNCRHRRWKVPKILLLRPGWEWSHRQGQQQHQGSVSFSSVCSLTLQVSQQHLGRIAASSVRSWAFCWSQQDLACGLHGPAYLLALHVGGSLGLEACHGCWELSWEQMGEDPGLLPEFQN
jgi:hypothetical protein